MRGSVFKTSPSDSKVFGAGAGSGCGGGSVARPRGHRAPRGGRPSSGAAGSSRTSRGAGLGVRGTLPWGPWAGRRSRPAPPSRPPTWGRQQREAGEQRQQQRPRGRARGRALHGRAADSGAGAGRAPGRRGARGQCGVHAAAEPRSQRGAPRRRSIIPPRQGAAEAGLRAPSPPPGLGAPPPPAPAPRGAQAHWGRGPQTSSGWGQRGGRIRAGGTPLARGCNPPPPAQGGLRVKGQLRGKGGSPGVGGAFRGGNRGGVPWGAPRDGALRAPSAGDQPSPPPPAPRAPFAPRCARRWPTQVRPRRDGPSGEAGTRPASPPTRMEGGGPHPRGKEVGFAGGEQPSAGPAGPLLF